jgi:AcrR family transcriptional regulator
MARAGLDPAAVVAAAAEIADRDGLDRLTLTKLATGLGVRPPSLYAHVGGLDDLRERLGVLAADDLADALAPAAAGRARGEALRAVGRAYREWARTHPGLYASLQPARARREPAVERVLELVLAVLHGYGLDDEEAIHAARSLRAALHGWVMLESVGGFGVPVDRDASFEWLLDMLDRGLSRGATSS